MKPDELDLIELKHISGGPIVGMSRDRAASILKSRRLANFTHDREPNDEDAEDMIDQMLDLQTRAREITNLAEAEGRELTSEEDAEMERLFAQFQGLEAEVDGRRNRNAQEQTRSQSRGRRTEPNPIHNGLPRSESVSGVKFNAGSRSRGPGSGQTVIFKNLATGEAVNGLVGIAPFDPANDTPVGDIIAALAFGNTSGLPAHIQNSITVGSDSGGGYVGTPAMSSRIIDLARAQSHVMRAGAITVPVPSSELLIGRITGDPTVSWRGKTGAITASTPTFGRFRLKPKMLAAIVPLTIEDEEDLPNIGQLIEQAIGSALGVEMDRVVLEGAGSANEPGGITNTAGVNSQTSVGTPTTYSQITTGITSILSANYPREISSLSWFMNPVIGGTYDGLTTGISGDNTPLAPTPWVRQLKRYHTTNLAGSGSPLNYNMIVGDFSEVLVGMRYSGVVIDFLSAGQLTTEEAESFNAVTQFMRFIRARVRMDCLVMRPSWFTVLSGVQA